MKTSTLRKGLLTLLMAVSGLSASAQFEKYTSYLNTSLTGMGLSYSKDSKLKFGIQATGGYFVEDGWMIYGRAGYEHQGHRGDIQNRNDLQLGVGGRYYFQQNGIYLGLGLMYAHATNVTVTEKENVWQGTGSQDKEFITRTVYNVYGSRNYIHFTPEVGYCFYVNQYLSIEPSVYFNLCLNRFSEGTEVGLKLGMGYYF